MTIVNRLGKCALEEIRMRPATDQAVQIASLE